MVQLRILKGESNRLDVGSENHTHGEANSVLKILLVEDCKSDAELIRIALVRSQNARPVKIFHCEYLRDALALLKTESVDIVLLDLSLPDSSGMESVATFKEHAPHLPVIILTGWDDRQASLQGIREGAQDYLIKGSFDYASLISAIDYAIERQSVRNIVESSKLQVQQENEFRKEVLEVVAHDLRSPLAGVIFQLEQILSGTVVEDLTGEQKKVFQQMYDNCNQVIELSRELLELESLKSKAFFNLSRVDLAPYIRKTYESFTALAARKGIILRLEMSPSLPHVEADAKRIAQVLNNLISNAIKFSFKGAQILVGVKVENSELIVLVQDNGQGIPEEDLPKLFVEFSRTRVRPTAGEDSVGVGLAIVKRIVDGHQGRLWVKSRPGKGSTFSFALKVAG